MFSQNIDPTLAKALTDRGYTSLTPVQLAVLEPEAQGRDLLVSARTGSGKTVAYGLVLAQSLLEADGSLTPFGAPKALVIAPTRELAMQVQRELQWLYAGARVASCVGGMDPRSERRALDLGCHIVVGTPGRLRDHLERGNLRLDQLGAVILDEADEMLDLGFREELEEILDATPNDRRTLLFSATLPKTIIGLASTYQHNALRLVVGGSEKAHSDIDYRAIAVAPNEVELAIVNVLRFFESGAAIVFCSTRENVRKLHANLVERGFSVVALSGELSQAERSHALQALRDRRARVCVATDVAARGIDIPDLDLVIHADLPNDRETMQHRSGRTGRAGRKGVCVVLVPYPRRRRLEQLFKGAQINATWQSPPTAEDIRARDQIRLIEDVAPAEDLAEDELAVARALMESKSALDIAAAYVRAVRQRMPAPEDLAENEPYDRGYQSQGASNSRNESRPDNRNDGPRAGFEDAIWFRLDMGRNKNAEARWLLPMICRRGHVTKRDIGAIRVFDRETRFQIAREMVDRFIVAVSKADGDGGRIELLGEDPPQRFDRDPRPERAAPPPREVKPERARSPEREKLRADESARRGPNTGAGPKKPWAPPVEDRAKVDARPPRPAGPKGDATKASAAGKPPKPKRDFTKKKKKKANGRPAD